MPPSDFRRLRQCAAVLAFVQSGSMDVVYKLIFKTVRFCTCFRRKKSKVTICRPRAPISYSLHRCTPSLQDLQAFCLTTLVANISSLDKKDVDSLPVDLAQRLFDCLASRRCLTYDNLTLFADQYLIHVSLCGVSHVDDAWLSVLNNPSLTALDISYCYQLTSQGLQELKPFIRLETLRLDLLTHLTDAGLTGLTPLINLRELSLKGCQSLVGSGFVHLSPLQSLTSLSCELCSSLVVGMHFIGRLKQLEHLNLGWCTRLPGRELAELRSLVNLTELCINGTKDCVRGLSKLDAVSKLKKLGLSGVCLHRDELQNISNAFSQLEELNLERSVFEPAYTDALPRLKHLKTLHLGFSSIRNRTLQTICEVTSLTELNLESCKLNDRGLNPLIQLTGLKSLDLADANIRDPGMEVVLKLTSLEKLSLAYTDVRDSGLSKLSKLTDLTDLNLDSRALTDGVMDHLSTLTALRRLDMFAARMKDPALKNLLPLTELESLELCGGLLTNQACTTIATLSHLTYLSLAQNSRINTHGAKHLAKLSRLISLNLSGTSVHNTLLPYYYILSRLCSLSVYNTRIKNEDIQLLHNYLPNLRVLSNFHDNV